jgi:two-component system nitrate/nitrite response regulator NarL
MGSARVKVLIVDGHDLFRIGARALLLREGFEVADSSSGTAALRRAPSFQPDVVVMAMNMTGMSGIEATALMLEIAPRASILILSDACGHAGVLDAVRAGASGYLLKDAPFADIVVGIRAAAVGESAFAPRVAGALLASVRDNAIPPTDQPDPASCHLSSREIDVLALLTLGLGNAEIADRLFLSSNTVKIHVARLLKKLGVANRVQAATFATRHGFFVDPLLAA